MSFKDRRFLTVAERADMRVILAATLGRFGANNQLIDAMDTAVNEEAVDVFISDDADEYVLLKMEGSYVLVTQGGFTKVNPGRTQ
ncbi:MAG: hypothetical protein WDN02_05210 [Methylovirgula sp.]|uniref:hypothetical protein n=1 Tax=Methylovirgula sp. TaxID=1978224 RepID=UPI0030765937